MSKFIRTVQKIDGINQKVILQVERCNNCPLMKFHQDNCIATCRVFSDKQSNIIDDFVVNYNVGTGEIYDRIDIPTWCLLPDFESQLGFDVKTYTVHNDKVLTSNAVVGNDLPIYIASEVVQNRELDVQELLPALVTASVFKNDADAAYEQAYSEYDESDYDEYDHDGGGFLSNSSLITAIKHSVCSLCGEENDTVNRNTNHGMCDKCWKVSYDDEQKKKEAFINNFRMKRGEPFKMETFNLSVLKTDNLNILITK